MLNLNNPVLPQSNLPGESVQWGRELQNLAQRTASSLESLESSVHMGNRASAGQLGVIGRQIETLSEQQEEIERQQQELENLVLALPQMVGDQVNTSGWSVDTPPASGSWTTVATSTLTAPAGRSVAVVQGIATASSTIQVFAGAMQGRIVISEVASTPVEGTVETLASVERTSLNTAFIRNFTAGSSVVVQFQVRGRLSDFPSSNVAALTVNASFTS